MGPEFYNSKLLSTLEVEYNKWFRENRSLYDFHRFDLLTGVLSNSDEISLDYKIHHTYFICSAEYPVFSPFGKYIGLYCQHKFIKPIEKSVLNGSNTDDFVTTPWSALT